MGGYLTTDGHTHAFIDNNGSPQICSQDYLLCLAEGDVSGHSLMTKMGVNPDIDNTEEDIWEVGGTYVFPTSDMGMEVVSSSVEDDIDKGASVAGTGVHKIMIYYLTSAYAEKTEEVTLNGTTAVPTRNTDIYRINYVEATTCGTGLAAAGNIDVRHLNDTPIYARISVGYTKSRQCIYTVPVNKDLYVYQVNFGAISAGTNGCRFTTRAKYSNLSGSSTSFFLPYSEIGVQNGSFSLDLHGPTKFISGTDLKISGIGTASNANIIATATIRGWLE